MAPRTLPVAAVDETPPPPLEEAVPSLVGIDGTTEEEASELDELAAQAFAAGDIPSREEIKARIEEGLSSGLLTERIILADIYASQYSCELMLRQLGGFLDNLAGSKLGARLLGGGGRKRGKQ